jgi:hypothetical protein
MTQVYVVTEGATDVRILKKLLPMPLVNETEFVAGSGSYSAQSLATTLLAVKQRPVALVVDADTDNLIAIQERRDFLRELLRQAASDVQFEVFTAVPELEIVFFQDKSLLEQLTQHTFTEVEWQAARHDPKAFLMQLFDADSSLIEKILANLTDETIRILQQHPLVRELSEFLATKVNGQQKPVAK